MYNREREENDGIRRRVDGETKVERTRNATDDGRRGRRDQQDKVVL